MTAFKEGSKRQRVLEMLSRPGGATIEEVAAESGWKPQSARGGVQRNADMVDRRLVKVGENYRLMGE